MLRILIVGLLLTAAARAGQVHVAVAANFTAVAEELAPLFKQATGHEVTYSFGSTGQLFAQITQGAPFEIFLAADDERPATLVEEGWGVPGSVFTYASGALVLYGPGRDLSAGASILAGGNFEKLAIADPHTAPYGAAALQTLEGLGLADALAGKLVTGENITQTLQFIETGNAELGFVAASQVKGRPGPWLVPSRYYEPIRQDAVLLQAGSGNPAAKAYWAFLGSETARMVIRTAGYIVAQ